MKLKQKGDNWFGLVLLMFFVLVMAILSLTVFELLNLKINSTTCRV